jgi:hypothetical protein
VHGLEAAVGRIYFVLYFIIASNNIFQALRDAETF